MRKDSPRSCYIILPQVQSHLDQEVPNPKTSRSRGPHPKPSGSRGPNSKSSGSRDTSQPCPSTSSEVLIQNPKPELVPSSPPLLPSPPPPSHFLHRLQTSITRSFIKLECFLRPFLKTRSHDKSAHTFKSSLRFLEVPQKGV